MLAENLNENFIQITFGAQSCGDRNEMTSLKIEMSVDRPVITKILNFEDFLLPVR